MQTASNPVTKLSTNAGLSNPALQIDPVLLPDLLSVALSDKTVTCSFEDGRVISFPIAWSEKLAKATREQRQAYEFNAHFIFWDDIDEIIGVRNILFGNQLHWK